MSDRFGEMIYGCKELYGCKEFKFKVCEGEREVIKQRTSVR